MQVFEEQSLLKRLELLPPEAKVAFAASAAGRLLSAFRGETESAEGRLLLKLQTAIDFAWSCALGTLSSRAAIEGHLTNVMALVPTEEEVRDLREILADDAVSSVAYVLRTLLRQDTREAVWAAKRVFEYLDQHTNENLDHPLVQTELSRQSRDINELVLAHRKHDVPSCIRQLRERTRHEVAF